MGETSKLLYPKFTKFKTGWWFQSWLLLVIVPYVGNVIIPTDFHIFQRGRAQPPTSKFVNHQLNKTTNTISICNHRVGHISAHISAFELA